MGKHIATTISEFLNEQIALNNPEEYAGDHKAPLKDGNEPMYDIIDMFPDMYNDKAYRDYTGYGLDDYDVINQIKYVHNKPKANVKIYRTVPDINKNINKEINDLLHLINYKFRYGFFPVNNDIINNLEDEVWKNNKTLKYDEMQKEVVDKLNYMVDELRKQKENPIKINNGDWVTTSRLYAKQHGESNLNNSYKIITKTVKASELYTDGNSIFEWGYNI